MRKQSRRGRGKVKHNLSGRIQRRYGEERREVRSVEVWGVKRCEGKLSRLHLLV
jgi:hypothetical protein